MKKKIITACFLASSLTMMSCGNTNNTTPDASASLSATAMATASPAESVVSDGADFMQYVTYTLPDSLKGYNLCSNDEFSASFIYAADSNVDTGRKHGESVDEICYNYATVSKYSGKAAKQFSDGALTGIDYPWNNCIAEECMKSLTVDGTPALLQSVKFELYTAPEIDELKISEDDIYSSYWCLSFTKEESASPVYYFFFSKDYFSEEDVTSFSNTVSFKEEAFK